MAQFTLTLDDSTAKKLAEIVETFGGSIPGFARVMVTDLCELPLEEIRQVRNELAMRAQEHRQKAAKRK